MYVTNPNETATVETRDRPEWRDEERWLTEVLWHWQQSGASHAALAKALLGSGVVQEQHLQATLNRLPLPQVFVEGLETS